MSHRGGRNFSLITITAGLFATSVSSFGADPVTAGAQGQRLRFEDEERILNNVLHGFRN